jgi:hypothetical protein
MRAVADSVRIGQNDCAPGREPQGAVLVRRPAADDIGRWCNPYVSQPDGPDKRGVPP